ncbi:MAG TPA: capsule assembly Wzi family protein [Acidobacteriaceae bacterium]|nr:capsule assembly Wzi family protein [Acidobacteriaceae bacterium]
MEHSSEVRVRSIVSGLFTGIAGLGLVLSPCAGTAQSAQTTAQTPVLSAPVPTTEGPDKIQSVPGYGQQPANPQSVTTPQKAPAPAVTTAPPTTQVPYTALPAYGDLDHSDPDGSVYIPVDSWVYPAMLRLYSLGYVDSMYLSMRPYTRRSVLHMLQASEGAILSSDDGQAQEILAALLTELADENITDKTERGTVYGLQSVYTRMMGISGQILTDSYHLGQTFFNDYGRPLETGFNNSTGFSTLNEQEPWSLYVRGEYQHAPNATGYSLALSQQVSLLDEITFAPPNDPQATIPSGPIATQNPFRLVEATLSYHVLEHEISLGKSDAWLGPGLGGAMDWSNNAENIYSFRINRIEPINIKYLSRWLGPVRYDFFYGSLKGHTDPNDDWVHSEMFSFAPTANFQFGFQRTVIFGGKGHEPVTMHTFLKGFFDTNDTNAAEKFSRDDPGARFSAFNFSYRLPFLRNYLTLYTDSETHDDLDPVSAPRRAAYRSGIYLSQFPGIRRLDLRVEGVSTDCSTLVCQQGSNEYIEDAMQKQAYTNKGNILGDWIGREAKGGQAWLTWHLSGNEWVQAEYMHKQTPGDFIPGTYNSTTNTYGPGGTTQNQFRVDVVKRIGPSVEVNGWYQHERWVAPIYMTGIQSDNTVTVQVTFFPRLKTKAP